MNRSAVAVVLCFAIEAVVFAAVAGAVHFALIPVAMIASYAIVRWLTPPTWTDREGERRSAELLASNGAAVDHALESVLLRRDGSPDIRIPLRQFRVEEVVVTDVSREDPHLVAFVDLTGPVRVQLRQVDVVGSAARAREVAGSLGLPLRLSSGDVESPSPHPARRQWRVAAAA